jgi:hypothetical protein
MALMRPPIKRWSSSSCVSPSAAHAYTAFLPVKVGPAPHQAGGGMFELSQLDLQLAFMTAGTLGKNIQNQASPVEHPALQGFFKIALLARGQGMIEEHDLGLVQVHCFANFLPVCRCRQNSAGRFGEDCQ